MNVKKYIYKTFPQTKLTFSPLIFYRQKHFCVTVMQPANKTFVWEHLAENVQSQQLSKSVATKFSLISYF